MEAPREPDKIRYVHRKSNTCVLFTPTPFKEASVTQQGKTVVNNSSPSNTDAVQTAASCVNFQGTGREEAYTRSRHVDRETTFLYTPKEVTLSAKGTSL